MKLCMSHYSHKSMADAKFDSSRVSIFEDMTSQNFHLRRGMSHRIQIFTPPPENGFNFIKMSF